MESLIASQTTPPFIAPKPALDNGKPSEARPAGVAGIGSCLPSTILTNFDLERMVDTSDEWILARTGIRERRIAGPSEATSDFAIGAARRALLDAGVSGDQVDLIIVATTTPDHPFPAVSNQVQEAIGASGAACFDLAAGCSGFIYALVTGAQFVRGGGYQRVLVIGAETLSRLVDWKDRSTCVLFGDGAGAALMTPCEKGYGILSYDLGADGAGAMLLYVDAGGSRHPASHETVAANRHVIKMSGPEVFKFAVRVIEESTLRAIDRAGLTTKDIDCFVAHQANARIFDAAGKRLGLSPDRIYNNVSRYGNTSTASIPLALDEARAEGMIQRGDVVALVGFGAGLSWASAIVRWQ